MRSLLGYTNELTHHLASDTELLQSLKEDLKAVAMDISMKHSVHCFTIGGEDEESQSHFKSLYRRVMMVQTELLSAIKALEDH